MPLVDRIEVDVGTHKPDEPQATFDIFSRSLAGAVLAQEQERHKGRAEVSSVLTWQRVSWQKSLIN